ncbi:hypothetical protein MM236_19340 [Belliella sp. DSM 107340]|uniref:Uncharacterized protein n=1 Tax=Belliella calami TaxID=2923436 RepID=A0ABS9UU58_9BACT|nr:hypothetical protein [Belliella calami]MCH7400157.1 hypothetical protein [Belliella calami]
MKKIHIIVFVFLIISHSSVFSQVKIGGDPNFVNPNSALEIESVNRGLLLPRISLSSTASPSPLIDHVEGMKIYNLSTTNDVTPGVYYNDGEKWVKLVDEPIEPWQIENSNAKATSNTQNIYQNGNVGIGDFSASNPITNLDVRGAVRVGTPSTEEVDGISPIAENSAAFGNGNRVSGQNSAAFGSLNAIFGTANSSAAFGTENGVRAPFSAVIGAFNEQLENSAASLIVGNSNGLNAAFSIVAGLSNVSRDNSSAVFGQYNNSAITGAVLQLGNGTGLGIPENRNNALTVMKNGNTGIGIIGNQATDIPTQMLDIGSGNVRVREINDNNGDTATDRVVVADEDGVLKTIDLSEINPKATLPKFFYMPSIIIPTSESQLLEPNSGALAGDSFDDNTLQGVIDLHGRYSDQFGTPMVSNLGSITSLPVLPSNELDYHIIWYDTNVFTAVSVNNSGVLNYTVNSNADVTIGSFMNIVFAVRED